VTPGGRNRHWRARARRPGGPYIAAPVPPVVRAPLWTRPFLLAFLASSVNSLGLHLYVHLPGHLSVLGADEFHVGVIMAIMAAAGLLARPYVGSTMDTHGRRVVAIGGGLVLLVATALYLAVEAIGPLIYFIRVLHGLAEAALFSVMFTMAADLVPAERRTEGMAIFGVSGVVPLALGPLLGDLVLHDGDYGRLYVTGLILAVASLAFLVPLPETQPRASASEPVGRGFFAAAGDGPLRPLWLAGFGFAFAVASSFIFMKTFVLVSGVAQVSHFFLPYGLCAMALRLGLGWVPDRLGPERTLLPSIASIAAGLWLLGAAEGPLQVMAAGVLVGVGHGYAFPILSALVITRCRPSERGSAMALFTALFDAGMLVGGPLLGLIAETTTHRTMFRTAAAVALLAAVAFAIWDRRLGPWSRGNRVTVHGANE
jgi:MFS family permease